MWPRTQQRSRSPPNPSYSSTASNGCSTVSCPAISSVHSAGDSFPHPAEPAEVRSSPTVVVFDRIDLELDVFEVAVGQSPHCTAPRRKLDPIE